MYILSSRPHTRALQPGCSHDSSQTCGFNLLRVRICKGLSKLICNTKQEFSSKRNHLCLGTSGEKVDILDKETWVNIAYVTHHNDSMTALVLASVFNQNLSPGKFNSLSKDSSHALDSPLR